MDFDIAYKRKYEKCATGLYIVFVLKVFGKYDRHRYSDSFCQRWMEYFIDEVEQAIDFTNQKKRVQSVPKKYRQPANSDMEVTVAQSKKSKIEKRSTTNTRKWPYVKIWIIWWLIFLRNQIINLKSMWRHLAISKVFHRYIKTFVEIREINFFFDFQRRTIWLWSRCFVEK